MSNNRSDRPGQRRSEEIEKSTASDVQNSPPESAWSDFDHFWHSCVKNGTPLLKESLKAHLKSMGWLSNQNRWISGAIHFGIPIEKSKDK